MTLCRPSTRYRRSATVHNPIQSAGVSDTVAKVSMGLWGLSVTTVASCPICLLSHCGCFGIITLQGLSRCHFHHFAFQRRILMRSVEVTPRPPPPPPHPAVQPHQSKLCHLILSGRARVRLTEAPRKRAVTQTAAVPLTLILQRKPLLYILI